MRACHLTSLSTSCQLYKLVFLFVKVASDDHCYVCFVVSMHCTYMICVSKYHISFLWKTHIFFVGAAMCECVCTYIIVWVSCTRTVHTSFRTEDIIHKIWYGNKFLWERDGGVCTCSSWKGKWWVFVLLHWVSSMTWIYICHISVPN